MRSLCVDNWFSIVNRQDKLFYYFLHEQRAASGLQTDILKVVETFPKQLWVMLTQDINSCRKSSGGAGLVTWLLWWRREVSQLILVLPVATETRQWRHSSIVDVTPLNVTASSINRPFPSTSRLQVHCIALSVLENSLLPVPATEMDAITFIGLNSSVVLLLFRRHDYESDNLQIIVLIFVAFIDERWKSVELKLARNVKHRWLSLWVLHKQRVFGANGC